MSTSRFDGALSASWSAAHVGAAIVLSVMTWTSALAGGVSDTDCVGTWKGFDCVTLWGPAGDPYVRLVPEPLNEDDRVRVLARDRKWLARCRPVVERDRYGVARYHYFAPNCEFGVGED